MFRTGHVSRGFTLVLSASLVILSVADAAAQSRQPRKFALLLAVPPKSAPGFPDPNAIQLANRNDVYRSYFDAVDPNIDSFTDYWWEISYGTVRVSGNVYGWVELPWPVLPKVDVLDPNGGTVSPDNVTTAAGMTGLRLPIVDLNGDGWLEQFEGEEIDQSVQAIVTDYNGDYDGTGSPDPNYIPAPGPTYETPGFVDFTNDRYRRPVWTPGERFRDLNGNGRYDALLEAFRKGWCAKQDTGDPNSGGGTGACCNGMTCTASTQSNCHAPGVFYPGQTCAGTPNVCGGKAGGSCGVDPNSIDPNSPCAGDGKPEPTDAEICDLDGDKTWDFPEPFEDFLRIYDPSGMTPESRWRKLDPSYKNTDEQDRAWAEAYIRMNYPGDVGEPLRYKGDTHARGFMARFGNDKYDGPDNWVESSGSGSKMQQRPGAAGMWVQGKKTRAPDDPANPYRWDYKGWWEAYWVDSHARTADFNPGPAPTPPTWDERIPNLAPFDPADPPVGLPTGMPFVPNCGGTDARRDQSKDCCKPPCDDPNACQNPDTAVDPASPGTGQGDDTTAPILPDSLDRNHDGIPDRYDGPAEFDDLPSSVYHARNVSGILNYVTSDPAARFNYGGDGRLGEVTSTRNSSIWGEDFSNETPNQNAFPDGWIPPGGPLAYNVHGANRYDAGNVLNLEFLTWMREAMSWPVRAITYDATSKRLWAADPALTSLTRIDPDPNHPTDPNNPVVAVVAPFHFADPALVPNIRAKPSSDLEKSLGIIHTLLASPWAICGNVCRYW